MGKVIPLATGTLLEQLEAFRQAVQDGHVKGAVILVASGDGTMAYSEGGLIEDGMVLLHFELWKRNAL
jgi:hypothetical protein